MAMRATALRVRRGDPDPYPEEAAGAPARRLSGTAGLAAGALAGLVMSAWKMGLDALQGAGVWGGPQLIATILLGPST